MPRYLDMLRAKNIFGGSKPLGMPDIDDGNIASMFRSVVPLANSLKNDDARRQRQMMEFEASLRNRQQPQSAPMMPPKKNVVYGGIHPPTGMQRQFREDDVAARTQRDRLSTLGATQSGALNNALITGKQRNDADMDRTVADINGREQVARMNKDMAAKAADDARTDKARMDADTATRKREPIIMDDPDNPGQKMMGRYNPVTNTVERIKMDDKQAGPASRMGIDKPTTTGSDNPAMKSIKDSAQDALSEIDNLIDKDDKLTSIAQSAVGKSRMNPLGYIPGSPKREGDASINRVRAQQVLSVIAQMKAQSKTGATGFGAMNLKELKVLEDAASKLDPMLGEEAFARELVRVRNILRKVMEEPVADRKPGSIGDIDKRTDDLIKKYGG